MQGISTNKGTELEVAEAMNGSPFLSVKAARLTARGM